MATPEAAKHRDLEQRFRDLERKVRDLGSAQFRPQLAVTAGDFTVADGGSLNVVGTGDLHVMHEDGVTPAITLGDQAIRAHASDGSERMRLDLVPSSLFPSFDNVLDLTQFDFISLSTANGSSVAVGGSVFPGVTVTVGAGENLRLNGLPTTSASPNLVHNAAFVNEVARSTSSRRYKREVQDVDIDPAAVLAMRGKSWRDRAEVHRDPDTARRHVGFIAEELDELGLAEFVTYDEQGRPDAIQYDRLSVGLLAVLQQQQQRIDALEARLDATPPVGKR